MGLSWNGQQYGHTKLEKSENAQIILLPLNLGISNLGLLNKVKKYNFGKYKIFWK